MNVFQKLAKSAESNHGLELQPIQVKELVTTLQAMQFQIANDQARAEALTRVLACALDQHGGALNIAATMFAEAENYVVTVDWSEDGEEIHARVELAEVAVPELQEDGEPASGSDLNRLPVQDGDSGGPEDREPHTDEADHHGSRLDDLGGG